MKKCPNCNSTRFKRNYTEEGRKDCLKCGLIYSPNRFKRNYGG